ncbi:hypothetical protein [Clostridium ganghwense]|uniref:ABC transporter permease n=1 Tax=Clostridium ganghwense TaxID=312089 RepID=A0ABT4CM02_9CLOT|nr:hypothetical protein [Clostridium ganghwense]MCY6370071.1 hypothetical protein [Clostridium ganghwense]
MREQLEILKAEFLKKFKTKLGISMILIFILVSIGSAFLKSELETESIRFEKGKEIVDTREPNVIANEKFSKKLKMLEGMSTSEEINYISSLHKKYKDYNKVFEDPLAVGYYVNLVYGGEIAEIKQEFGYKSASNFRKEKKKAIREGRFNIGEYNFLVDTGTMIKDKVDKVTFKEYKDVTFWKVFNHRIFHPLIALFMLAFAAVIFSNIYTDEIVSGVDNLILTSKNKYKVLNSKIILTVLTTVGMYLLYLLIQFIAVWIVYGTSQNGNLQAFRILDAGIFLKSAMTIQGYAVLKIGVCILILITISMLAAMSSFLTTNSLASIGVFGTMILIPKVAGYIKGVPSTVKAILDNLVIDKLLFKIEAFVGMYLGRVNLGNSYLDINNAVLFVIFTVFVLSIAIIKIKSRKLTVNK